MARKGVKTTAGYAGAPLPGDPLPQLGGATIADGTAGARSKFVTPGTPMPAPPPAGRVVAQPSGGPARTEVERMAGVTRNGIVEVDVTYERGPNCSAEPLLVTTEVWTQNTVYAVDARMRCVAVRAIVDNSLVEDHPFLGTRLVGGQLKSEDSVEMSYPLPRPGSFAVFEGRKGKKRRFSRTSVVERVVMRLRVVTITGSDVSPTWEELVAD